MKGLSSSEVVKVEAVVVEKSGSPLQGQKIDLSQAEEGIWAGLELADKHDTEEAVEVKILIGLDYYWSIIKGGVVRIKNGIINIIIICNGKIYNGIINNKYSFILSGSVEAPNREYTHCYVSNATITNLMVNIDHCTQDGANVSRYLDRFWGFDGLGIVDDQMDIECKVDIQFDGEKYVVGLPWKVDHPRIRGQLQTCMKEIDVIVKKTEERS